MEDAPKIAEPIESLREMHTKAMLPEHLNHDPYFFGMAVAFELALCCMEQRPANLPQPPVTWGRAKAENVVEKIRDSLSKNIIMLPNQ